MRTRRSAAWRARVLLVAALLFTLFMALDPAPPDFLPPSPSDKLEHMSAFAVLALLARLGFPRSPDWRILEHLSFLGALIEVAQALPFIDRDCDLFDWIADTMAIAAVLLLARLFRSRKT